MASPDIEPNDQAAASSFGRNVAIGCGAFLLAIMLTVMTWVIVWNREANLHRDQIPSNGLPPPPVTPQAAKKS